MRWMFDPPVDGAPGRARKLSTDGPTPDTRLDIKIVLIPNTCTDSEPGDTIPSLDQKHTNSSFRRQLMHKRTALRRLVIAGLALSLPLGLTATALAQAKPFKIGFILPMTGQCASTVRTIE